MRIEKPQVRIISTQSEELGESKPLSEDEQKKFLYLNYPDLYKQMCPEKVQDKKINPIGTPQPHQKRVDQDIQQTNKVYTYNKYGSEELGEGNDFSYNIQIKTDMNFKR